MTGFNLPRTQGSARILLALLASSAVFTAGCANMATTASSTNVLSNEVTLSGKIHGGSQPVAFATVKLWYVGQGSAAGVLTTTTSADDGAGSFSFVMGGSGSNGFTCPGGSASSTALIYVTATGGNTMNTHDSSINNAASVFLAPYGICSSLAGGTTSTGNVFVDMTEVTTVATMTALQQYFNPAPTSAGTLTAESFAINGTGQAKVIANNAFALIHNLVDTTTGTAITSTTLTGGAHSLTAGVGYAGTSVTATPESAKINLLANILASCINNASATAANCVTLMNNAAPPASSSVTSRLYGTTFTAPTDVLQAIYYILTNPTNGSTTKLANLFGLQPAIGAPFQPALATQPSDWTIAINYTSTSTCGTNSGHLINSAQDLAIDIYGALWIANSEAGVGNLTQLNNLGQPISCLSVGTGALTGVTIDSKSSPGNIWVADSGANNVYKYLPGSSATSITAFPTAAPPYAIAADGAANIYFTTPSTGSLYSIPQGAITSGVTPLAISSSVGPGSNRIMMDASPAVWTTSGSTFITRTTSLTPNSGTGFSDTQIADDGPTYGITTSWFPSGVNQNYVYVGNQGSTNDVFLHKGVGTSYSSVTGWPVTGLSTPTAVASDGAINVYTLNNATGTLFAMGLNKQAISPATGFVKPAGYLTNGRSMVIDQSGNIWVGMDNSNSVTEIVGAAVPVNQPFANALSTNGFQRIP